MTDLLKQAYLDKMKAELKILGAKVDVVKAQLAKETAGLRIDVHTQIENWQTKESSFNKKLEELLASGAETFETVKASVQTAWDDLSHYAAETFEKSAESASEKTPVQP